MVGHALLRLVWWGMARNIARTAERNARRAETGREQREQAQRRPA
jgi:hypothetical protein